MWDLDIGCGSGDVTFLLGEPVGEPGEVVGRDHDDDALATARAVRPNWHCLDRHASIGAASRTCLNPWAPSTPPWTSSTEV
ncbi:methyltransferase domain-containing protein [Pseudomonas oryzihabitans]|uniref:methyltransferase domain-containing protein n=1 Tax=Pseudomonas oryzihabitans TaxID=47885 RepID=UPI0033AEE242